jgi:hypothetical protein
VPPEIIDEGHRILSKCKDTSKYRTKKPNIGSDLFREVFYVCNISG